MVKRSIKPAEENLPINIEVTPVNRQQMIEECDRRGLTLAHLITTIKEATCAYKYTYDKLGDPHEEVDHPTRLRAAMTGLEIRGELKPVASGGGVPTFIDVKAIINQFKAVNKINGEKEKK